MWRDRDNARGQGHLEAHTARHARRTGRAAMRHPPAPPPTLQCCALCPGDPTVPSPEPRAPIPRRLPLAPLLPAVAVPAGPGEQLGGHASGGPRHRHLRPVGGLSDRGRPSGSGQDRQRHQQQVQQQGGAAVEGDRGPRGGRMALRSMAGSGGEWLAWGPRTAPLRRSARTGCCVVC